MSIISRWRELRGGRPTETIVQARRPVDPHDTEYVACMQRSLARHYFNHVSPNYLETQLGKDNMRDHVSRRYEWAAHHVMPWLARRFDLSPMTVIEIGSGTGSSTLALAQVAAAVECYELHDGATAVARDRLSFWGTPNVQCHSVLFDKRCRFIKKGGRADAILLYATLEHMYAEECLDILALGWRILRPGGFMAIAETPNRLSMLDEHTSLLPFFSQLPREIQVRYAPRSPRDDFRWAIADAAHRGHGKALDMMTRWGSGVSYHEFELALGDEVHSWIVLDGYEPEIAEIFPVTAIDTTLQDLFQQLDVRAHRAFTRRNLFFVLQKP
jgi:protein-L-isoaspartate O-methyltransferase